MQLLIHVVHACPIRKIPETADTGIEVSASKQFQGTLSRVSWAPASLACLRSSGKARQGKAGQGRARHELSMLALKPQ